MCEVEQSSCSAAPDDAGTEFAYLNPPQQCDEPLPPYKEIKPVYDGQFTERFPQLDAVSLSLIEFNSFNVYCTCNSQNR